jgi:hypothetical protein
MGMVACADCIDDMAMPRHAGMGTVSTRAYAPSTLGSFLRASTFGGFTDSTWALVSPWVMVGG